MTREQLLAMGLTEEQVNQIMAAHGQATQGLRAQLTTLTENLNAEKDKTTTVQQPNQQTEPPANKELEDALKRIKELEGENKRKDIAAYAAEKGLSGEQVLNILKAFGDDVDIVKGAIDSISQIISDNRTAAAAEKEKELAKGSTNPGGGKGAGAETKTTAEQIAGKLFSAKEQKNSILSHYVGGN